MIKEETVEHQKRKTTINKVNTILYSSSLAFSEPYLMVEVKIITLSDVLLNECR
jgi:hypothetical protein